MREILFRGKRCDNGEWVEGLPIKTYDTKIGKNSVDYANPVPVVLMASGRIVLECGYDEVPFFNTDEYPIVNPETVGEYTGMTDKNGKKIFAGDIISTSSKLIGAVKWNDTFAKYIVCYNQISGNWFDFEGEDCFSVALDCVIIGNIHDNPELLK